MVGRHFGRIVDGSLPLLFLLAGCESDDSRPETDEFVAGTDTEDPWTDVGDTEGEDPDGDTPSGSSTAGKSDDSGDDSGTPDYPDDEDPDTTGDADEPAEPDCDTTVFMDADPPVLPEDYAFETVPPITVPLDTIYGYFIRTRIGACSTDRVWWSLVDGPDSAYLEVAPDVRVGVGEEYPWEDGGAARERATLVWDPAFVDAGPGCYPFTVQWRAWRDCGVFSSGDWGPLLTQTFEVAVGG